MEEEENGDKGFQITVTELETLVDEIYQYGAAKTIGDTGIEKLVKKLRTNLETGIVSFVPAYTVEKEGEESESEEEVTKKVSRKFSHRYGSRIEHFGMNLTDQEDEFTETDDELTEDTSEDAERRRRKKRKKKKSLKECFQSFRTSFKQKSDVIFPFWKLPFGRVCCNFRLCIFCPLIFLSLCHIILSLILDALNSGNPENTLPTYLGWIQGFVLYVVFCVLSFSECMICIYTSGKSTRYTMDEYGVKVRKRKKLSLLASNEEANRQTSIGMKYHVVRNGSRAVVKLLYPGDIILLKFGNIVPGDGILVDSDENFSTNESFFTGSSHSVLKSPDNPLLLSQSYVETGEGRMLMLIPESLPHKVTIHSKLRKDQDNSKQTLFDMNDSDSDSDLYDDNKLLEKIPLVMKKSVKRHITCMFCFGIQVCVIIAVALAIGLLLNKFTPNNTWTINFVPDPVCSNTSLILMMSDELPKANYCGSIGYDLLFLIEYLMMIVALLVSLHPRWMMFVYQLSRLDMSTHLYRKGLKVREARSVERFSSVNCVVIGDGVLTQENHLKIEKVWLAGKEWEYGLSESPGTQGDNNNDIQEEIFYSDNNGRNNLTSVLSPLTFSKELDKKGYEGIKEILIEAFSTVSDVLVTPILPSNYDNNNNNREYISDEDDDNEEKEMEEERRRRRREDCFEDIGKWKCKGDRMECSTLIFLCKSFGMRLFEKDLRFVKKKFLYRNGHPIKSVVLYYGIGEEEDIYLAKEDDDGDDNDSIEEDDEIREEETEETEETEENDSEGEKSESESNEEEKEQQQNQQNQTNEREEIIEILDPNERDDDEDGITSTITENDDNNKKNDVFRVYVYGDALTVISNCGYLNIQKNRIIFQTGTKMSFLDKMKYDASRGLRTTAIAYKDIIIGENEALYRNPQLLLEQNSREDYESGLTLLGIFAAKVTIPPSISKSVVTLRKAEIPVVYMTKYPLELAKTVAESAGIWDGHEEKTMKANEMMSLTSKFNRLFDFHEMSDQQIRHHFRETEQEDEDEEYEEEIITNKKPTYTVKKRKAIKRKRKKVKMKLRTQSFILKNLRIVAECSGPEKAMFVQSLRRSGNVCCCISSLNPGIEASAVIKYSDIGISTSRCSERVQCVSDVIVDTGGRPGRKGLREDEIQYVGTGREDNDWREKVIIRKREEEFAKSNKNILRHVIWCMLRGRMMHDNLKRYARFQLICGIVLGLFITLTALTRYFPLNWIQTYNKNDDIKHQYPFVHNELVFSPLQIFLVTIFIDVVGGLSYLTETPFPNLLKRRIKVENKNQRNEIRASLIGCKSFISILIQSSYQLFVLIFLYYGGIWIDPFEIVTVGDFQTAEWQSLSKYYFLSSSSDEDFDHHHRMTYRPKVRSTMVFYMFLLFMICNLINSRRFRNGICKLSSCNNCCNSCFFLCSICCTCCVVFVIVCVGYSFVGYSIFQTTGLEWYNFLIPLLCAFGTIIMQIGYNNIAVSIINKLCISSKRRKNNERYSYMSSYSEEENEEIEDLLSPSRKKTMILGNNRSSHYYSNYSHDNNIGGKEEFLGPPRDDESFEMRIMRDELEFDDDDVSDDRDNYVSVVVSNRNQNNVNVAISNRYQVNEEEEEEDDDEEDGSTSDSV